MASIGLDHGDSGEKFYVKFPFKKYPQLISKITKQKVIDKPLLLEFNIIKSVYSMKYSLSFQNLFWYRLNRDYSNNVFQLINFNLDLSQKSKMIKLVNFDILPVIRFSMNNASTYFPFTLSFKLGKYQASRVQHFDNINNENFSTYDFSKVLKSMLPYYRTGIKISHSKTSDVYVLGKKVELMLDYIASVNRIHNYEDNLKFATHFKFFFSLYEELFRLARLRVSNEFVIKKAFIDNKAKKTKSFYVDSENTNTSKLYKEHHILSGYECHSKLLEMNFLNRENVIENGSDFYIQDVLTLRLKDIPYLKDNEVLSRVNPYFSLETIFLPAYFIPNVFRAKEAHLDWKNSFKFIYTLGLSLELNEFMHADFALYTGASKNTHVNKELLTRFRINLNF